MCRSFKAYVLAFLLTLGSLGALAGLVWETADVVAHQSETQAINMWNMFTDKSGTVYGLIDHGPRKLWVVRALNADGVSWIATVSSVVLRYKSE